MDENLMLILLIVVAVFFIAGFMYFLYRVNKNSTDIEHLQTLATTRPKPNHSFTSTSPSNSNFHSPKKIKRKKVEKARENTMNFAAATTPGMLFPSIFNLLNPQQHTSSPIFEDRGTKVEEIAETIDTDNEEDDIANELKELKAMEIRDSSSTCEETV